MSEIRAIHIASFSEDNGPISAQQLVTNLKILTRQQPKSVFECVLEIVDKKYLAVQINSRQNALECFELTRIGDVKAFNTDGTYHGGAHLLSFRFHASELSKHREVDEIHVFQLKSVNSARRAVDIIQAAVERAKKACRLNNISRSENRIIRRSKHEKDTILIIPRSPERPENQHTSRVDAKSYHKAYNKRPLSYQQHFEHTTNENEIYLKSELPETWRTASLLPPLNRSYNKREHKDQENMVYNVNRNLCAKPITSPKFSEDAEYRPDYRPKFPGHVSDDRLVMNNNIDYISDQIMRILCEMEEFGAALNEAVLYQSVGKENGDGGNQDLRGLPSRQTVIENIRKARICLNYIAELYQSVDNYHGSALLNRTFKCLWWIRKISRCSWITIYDENMIDTVTEPELSNATFDILKLYLQTSNKHMWLSLGSAWHHKSENLVKDEVVGIKTPPKIPKPVELPLPRKSTTSNYSIFSSSSPLPLENFRSASKQNSVAW